MSTKGGSGSSSSGGNPQLRLRKLHGDNGLLRKMMHHDKDERYMACVDLTSLLDSCSAQSGFRLDTITGQQVVSAITKQLSDSSADVQTVSVKLIANIGGILDLKQVLTLANGLCGLAVDPNNETSRDIYAIGLKSIITSSSSSSSFSSSSSSSSPFGSGNDAKKSSASSSSHAEVCKTIMKRMCQAIQEFVAPKANGSGDFSTRAADEEVVKSCLEVVTELLTHTGHEVSGHHESFASSLRWLFTHSSEYIRKRCVSAVGALVTAVNQKLFDVIMKEVIIARMEEAKHRDVVYSYMQALAVVVTRTSSSSTLSSSSSPSATITASTANISGYIDEIVPKLLSFVRDEQHEEDEDEAIKVALLQDNCLLSLTAMIRNCNLGLMKPYLADVFATALKLACSDANYAYDSEVLACPSSSPSSLSLLSSSSSSSSAVAASRGDEEEDGDEGWGSDDGGDWMDGDDLVNDKTGDDTSWRVRRCAVDLLRTCVELPDVYAMLSDKQRDAAWGLFVDRLKERDVAVSVSVCAALKQMTIALHLHHQLSLSRAATVTSRLQQVYHALETANTDSFDIHALRAMVPYEGASEVNVDALSRSLEQCLLKHFYINEEQAKSTLSSASARLARFEAIAAAVDALVTCVVIFKDPQRLLSKRLVPVLALFVASGDALDVQTQAGCYDALRVVLALDKQARSAHASVAEMAFQQALCSKHIRLMEHAFGIAQLFADHQEEAKVNMFAELTDALSNWQTVAPLGSSAFDALSACVTVYCQARGNQDEPRAHAVVAFLIARLHDICQGATSAFEGSALACLTALHSLAALSRSSSVLFDDTQAQTCAFELAQALAVSWKSNSVIATLCLDTLLHFAPRALAAVEYKTVDTILMRAVDMLSDQAMSLSASVLALCARLVHNISPERALEIDAKVQTLVCSSLMLTKSALFEQTAAWQMLRLQAQGINANTLEAFVSDRLREAVEGENVAVARAAPVMICAEVLRRLQLPSLTAVVEFLWQKLASIASMNDSKNALKGQAVLMLLGRVGPFCGASATNNVEQFDLFARVSRIAHAFNSDVKTQAGVCLGGFAVGSPNTHIPAFLAIICDARSDSEDVVLAFQGLHQCLLFVLEQLTSSSEAHSQVVPLLLERVVQQALLSHASNEREAITSLVCGILGALAVLADEQWLTLTTLLNGSDTLGMAVSAFHVALNLLFQHNRCVQLRKFANLMPSLLSLLSGSSRGNELDIKRNVLLIVNICLHHEEDMDGGSTKHIQQERGSDAKRVEAVTLVTDDQISDLLLPFCYAHVTQDEKSVVTVEYGPFKHVVDKALPLRRTVFQTLHLLVAHRLFVAAACTPDSISEFFQYAMAGLSDKETDLQILAYQIMTHAVTMHGDSVLLTPSFSFIIDRLPEVIFPNVKLQLKLAKSDTPERAMDVLTACVKCMYAIASVQGYEQCEKFFGFYQRVLNTERLKLILKDIVAAASN